MADRSLITLAGEPAKMTMTNLLNPALSIEPQYNPTELEELIAANWTELTIPGLSHRRMQYIDTSNDEFNFTLHYDTTDQSPVDHEKFLSQRKWLMAHTVPRGGGSTIIDGAAPRVLFSWPTLVSIVAVIRSVRFRYLTFNTDLSPTRWDADVKITEIRDSRLTFDDVLINGTFRGRG